MKTAHDGLPKGQRRGARASLKLIAAMKQIPEEVMVYLAEVSGFYKTSATLTHAELAYIEGRRSLFADILHFQSAPLSEIQRIQAAALEEARISSEEGGYPI